MKASRFFIGTLKEAPADAEIVSHQLMLRAGMIRRVAGGIYDYLPIGLRSVRKVERIVREEMERAGAIEILMPGVQPAELWQESGRWEQYGPELLRLRDRHQRDFVLGPTHEEVVTDIARREIKSYRQLPVNLFQIQTKFRDEIRPRFGVMRGREFIMKDAYSFDRDVAGLQRSYEAMYEAYTRIFTRLGLDFRAVAADNGSIGGSGSHEFHVIADTGEDAIVYCPDSDYAANIEAAEALAPVALRDAGTQPLTRVPTPGRAKCEAVAEQLGIGLEHTIKSIVLAVDAPEEQGGEAQIVLLLLRGDHSLNEIKASKVAGLSGWRFASEAEIVDHFGTPPGYLGPIGTRRPVRVIADRTVAAMSDFVCGANEVDYHLNGVNWERDLPEAEVADLRNVVEGDPSPDGKGTLSLCRGIEVGHVFQLGTKYSEAMSATYLDETGKPQPMQMGCYGIGVTRILGAAIEQNYDARGMIWPESIAPFEVVICPMGWDRSEAVREQAGALYDALRAAGVDVILDDRGERPGVMFADWELIGVPHRLVVGDRGLKEGKIEYQGRRDEQASLFDVGVAADEVIARIRAALNV
ncbi:proline--tRNA ligase [Chitinasiproducens palmae]|uniref:Proline--tRNA ligase n=1 Tax=Chitinasiproducens palmae TaxID=1770053 RepID=A0A1H2PRQ9_9BURK|nr:proline--tRNA ligase [Chitinasiproducens palmae]SDV49561.1 prolyl-tRNA synthetase [Chitinasiproducens palmae]